MEINEAMFKTKVDNIFIQLYSAITLGNLEEVRHFLSTNLYEKIKKEIENLESNSVIQIYDEINVKDTKILRKEEKEDTFIVVVEIISRYMDYQIDKATGKIVSGTDERRVEKLNILTFEKKKNAISKGLIIRCPSCGASMNVNKDGKCDYCGSIFPQENYDFVLVSMETKEL